MFYIFNEQLQNVLKKSKRDQRIWNSIQDLTQFTVEQKKERARREHFCPICCADKPEDQYVECDRCERWYHPTCIGTTIEDINEKDEFTKSVWHCPFCSNDDMWVVRNS